MPRDARPAAKAPWLSLADLPGLAAVAAAYLSFLLHAQFGFLALLAQRLGPQGPVRPVMAVMALAGLGASLATGAALRRVSGRRLAVLGLAGSAVAAIASLACGAPWSFGLVAALVGAATGVTTVALASDLRHLVTGRALGLGVGLATGVAYLASNLPVTFHGSPTVQALVPAAACLGAAALLDFGPHPDGPPAPTRALGADDARGLGLLTLVLSFLALVWLDSAAFRIVQETVELRGVTWGSPALSTAQGLVHLVAAVAAGHLVDRGAFRSLLLGTWALFASAFWLLQAGHLPPVAAGPLYAIGISAYSTALVLAPSLGPDRLGLVPRRWRAALTHGVAGWIGSTLGIGMATDLHRIPAWFVATSGAVVLVAALGASARGRLLLRAHAPAVGLAALALGVALLVPERDASALSPAERGRRVYVAEGCLNCHSQYVRPATDDVEAWGPARRDQLAESPPLLGNRRIGPDLLNVANRRSATWQRLHLESPRAVVAGSRMPSYAHLFADGDGRGDDLIAYLTTLGATTLDARASAASGWTPPSPEAGRGQDGAALFARHCAACHGPHGRGDGPLAARIPEPFLDLGSEKLWLLPPHGPEQELQEIERAVRFGVPGTTMAGHEWLSDAEVASLAQHVERLRREAGAPTAAEATP